MKAAVKTRKRKHSSGKLAATRRGKVLPVVSGKSGSATGVRAIPVATKSAKAAKQAAVSVMQNDYDHPGRPNAVIAIDASSPTFGEDLRSAFEKNVAKARRENKRRFGSPDPQIFKGREP
jgi:hypothetical protein